MTLTATNRRLLRLEITLATRRVVFLWRRHDETDLDAERRWLADNPGRRLNAADLRVIIVRWAGSESFEQHDESHQRA